MNKKELLDALYKRDGRKCHYCGIAEDDFRAVWGQKFYGGVKRGGRLEIDRKNHQGIYEISNCVLACALCNMAKSDMFTYNEFKRLGVVIREIWQHHVEEIQRPLV
jgi:hypothetical protein